MASEDDHLKFLRGLNGALLALQQQIDPLRGAMAQLHSSTFMTDAVAAVQRLNAFAGPQFANAVEAIRELDRKTSFARKISDLRIATAPPLAQFAGAIKTAQFDILGTHALTQIRSDLQSWERLSRSAGTQLLAERAVGWAAGVRSVIGAAENAELPETVVGRLIAPTAMLTRLTSRTARRIRASADDSEKRRLSASLELVESQVTGHMEELGHVVTESEYLDEDALAPDSRLVLADLEQKQMLAAPAGIDESAAALAGNAGSVRLHSLAREAIRLVHDVNLAARLASKGDIFKLTNRLLQVAIELPWIDASGERGLGDFIDHLYFMLYEGAGKDSLRYLVPHGGPLDDTAADVVFLIKHLRNKWLRHDPEHGDDKSIRKSYEQLRDRLKSLGLSGMPRSAADYRGLQERLLERVTAFLRSLLEALRPDGPAR
jgi:hypothetical protein